MNQKASPLIRAVKIEDWDEYIRQRNAERKTLFRLLDPDLSADWGRPVYLDKYAEGPTDDPEEALQTTRPERWDSFVAEVVENSNE
jgi:hypothetical protein